MNQEQRKERIAELERELVELRRQESEYISHDHEALLAECRELNRYRKGIEAMKLYRTKVGCWLREAHYAIEAL